jgi:hypothetical protein
MIIFLPAMADFRKSAAETKVLGVAPNQASG